MVSVLRKQDPANQYTGFICTARRHVALKNIIALCRELQNVKPVRRPLFRPRAVPHTLKLHAFLVTLYCTVYIKYSVRTINLSVFRTFSQLFWQCLSLSLFVWRKVDFPNISQDEFVIHFPQFPWKYFSKIFTEISIFVVEMFPCLSCKSCTSKEKTRRSGKWNCPLFLSTPDHSLWLTGSYYSKMWT